MRAHVFVIVCMFACVSVSESMSLCATYVACMRIAHVPFACQTAYRGHTRTPLHTHTHAPPLYTHTYVQGDFTRIMKTLQRYSSLQVEVGQLLYKAATLPPCSEILDDRPL